MGMLPPVAHFLEQIIITTEQTLMPLQTTVFCLRKVIRFPGKHPVPD